MEHGQITKIFLKCLEIWCTSIDQLLSPSHSLSNKSGKRCVFTSTRYCPSSAMFNLKSSTQLDKYVRP